MRMRLLLQVDGGTSYAAIAARGKAHSQAGRSRRADGGVGVAKSLPWQCPECDGLAVPGNRERLWNVWCSVVVAVTGLRCSDRAGAYAGEVDHRTSSSISSTAPILDRPTERLAVPISAS